MKSIIIATSYSICRDQRNEQRILAAVRQFISESTKSRDPVYAEHILVIQGLEPYNKSRHSILNAAMNAVFTQSNRRPFGMIEVLNMKAFQSNENHLLADSLGYILNKFEHLLGGGDILYGEVQVEQVWTCRGCWVSLYGGGVTMSPVTDQWHLWQWSHGGPSRCGQNDRHTRLKS